ncbi:hypothetical protein WI38_26595 [Burkholderia ubonensis]|uniref:OmpA-like domain-containing protein n=1 Tax=Burkholderia ubonensis TaxID=101571 RepID=A0A102KAG7_9BURK|nr:OmpA family protein [Burkholderia ubonensis]KUZ71725.1 hypothetical protein WI35_12630 [Burkholderia ubonensis]KUZ77134.1 hypothetical protein WI37_15940 [Burkholderia ubonensis]KUZ83856.1 hypothetical protein WI38_26595 [Burkholderia ubonensis]KUZ97472.1 hypothetical protein WI39_08825 [Burkholderia ubonensis]
MAAKPALAPIIALPLVLSAPKVLLHADARCDFDEVDLEPAAKRDWDRDRVIGDAGGKRFRFVQVSGYTDSACSKYYTTRRARSVTNYLREPELQADRFIMTGFGKSNLLASGATEEGAH